MSIFSRFRNVSPSGNSGEYSKLPSYTPTQSPPFPAVDHESKTPSLWRLSLPLRRTIQTYCRPPTKRQFIYSTTYAITLALIAVIVTQMISPWRPTYFQWVQTRSGQFDPFDEHGTSSGAGKVSRAMWGLHEETGWDRAAILEERGYAVLDSGERYHLHHNATEEGTIQWVIQFRVLLIEPMSVSIGG